MAEALFDSLDTYCHRKIRSTEVIDMLEALRVVHERILGVLQSIPLPHPQHQYAISRSMFIAASSDTLLTLPQAYDLFNVIAGPGRDCVDQSLFEYNMAFVATQLEREELGLALSCLGFEDDHELSRDDFLNMALTSMSWD
jgi:hypothetical protein